MKLKYSKPSILSSYHDEWKNCKGGYAATDCSTGAGAFDRKK